MRLSSVGSVAACVSLVHGFRDTSPFFLASTSQFPSTVDEPIRQLQKGSSVLSDAKDFLSSCPSDEYIIISQPGVHATDFTQSKPFAVLLRSAIEKSVARKEVSEVVGAIDAAELQAYIQNVCGAQVFEVPATGSVPEAETIPRILSVELPEVNETGAKRMSLLQQNDAKLQHVLGDVRAEKRTIIYVSTPTAEEPILYEASFADPVHTEMKRGIQEEAVTGPLFVTYAFLSPGIFMGLLAGLLLLIILSVGVKAVGSLQVSYAAFEKEMGPAAQKK